MEIFTTRQLYQGLKERIAQDSSGSMEGLSALDNPLTLRLPGILGEQEIRVNRIDQLPGLLQGYVSRYRSGTGRVGHLEAGFRRPGAG